MGSEGHKAQRRALSHCHAKKAPLGAVSCFLSRDPLQRINVVAASATVATPGMRHCPPSASMIDRLRPWRHSLSAGKSLKTTQKFLCLEPSPASARMAKCFYLPCHITAACADYCLKNVDEDCLKTISSFPPEPPQQRCGMPSALRTPARTPSTAHGIRLSRRLGSQWVSINDLRDVTYNARFGHVLRQLGASGAMYSVALDEM